MATEGQCIQAKASGKGFDGARYLFVGKPAVHDFPALGNRPEKGAAFDPSCIQPIANSMYGASDRTPHDSDRATLALLIGLRAPDRDNQAAPAGAAALVAYAFECAKREHINGGWGGNWDGMMGNYNEPNADGEMEHAGNHVSELLQSLTAFLRIEA